MSKLGDIYRVHELTPNRFFQLVALDITQLNSDVIAVFAYQGSVSDKVSADDLTKIVTSGVEFYAHTMVNVGKNQKLWSKIGKSEPVQAHDAVFKHAFHEGVPDPDTYGKGKHDDWVIWKIGEEWTHVGPNIAKYPQAELGSVFAPPNMVYRIQHGKYPGPAFYEQER